MVGPRDPGLESDSAPEPSLPPAGAAPAPSGPAARSAALAVIAVALTLAAIVGVSSRLAAAPDVPAAGSSPPLATPTSTSASAEPSVAPSTSAPTPTSSAPVTSTTGEPGSTGKPTDVREARAAEREGRWADAARGWAAVHARTGERRHFENLLVAALVALRDALEHDRPDEALALVEGLLLPLREQARARETLATAYRRIVVHQTQAVRLADARAVARRMAELGPPWDADARALLKELDE